MELQACPICSETSCSECRHVCAWCGDTGCEACSIHGMDGWFCSIECEQFYAKSAHEADLLADEHVLEIVVGRMIDCVMGQDETRGEAA